MSLLEITDPYQHHQSPGLSERGIALSKSHWVCGRAGTGAKISQVQVRALFPTLNSSNSAQTGGWDFPPGKPWGGPAPTLRMGLQGSDICEGLTGQFTVWCFTCRGKRWREWWKWLWAQKNLQEPECWHSLLSLDLGRLPTLERREGDRAIHSAPLASLLSDNPYGDLVKGETGSSGKAHAEPPISPPTPDP